MKICRASLAALAFSVLAVNAHARRLPTPTRVPTPHAVPEIDPSMATGAVALLSGTAMILRRGRIKA